MFGHSAYIFYPVTLLISVVLGVNTYAQQPLTPAQQQKLFEKLRDKYTKTDRAFAAHDAAIEMAQRGYAYPAIQSKRRFVNPLVQPELAGWQPQYGPQVKNLPKHDDVNLCGYIARDAAMGIGAAASVVWACRNGSGAGMLGSAAYAASMAGTASIDLRNLYLAHRPQVIYQQTPKSSKKGAKK